MSRIGLTWLLFVVGSALAAGPPSATAPKVGVVSVIERESKAQQGDKVRVLTVRDTVFRNERLTTSTDKETLLHLRLLDDTVLTLGPSSEMVLDDFAINTDAGTAEVQVKLARGLLRFAGGRHAGAGVRYQVKTPVATIGVRGTSFNLLVEEDGTTIAQLEEGEMVMENESGDEVVIDDPNESSSIDESGSAPSEPEINDELIEEFDSLDLDPEQQAADEALEDELDEAPIEVIEDEDPDTDAGDVPESGDDSDADSSESEDSDSAADDILEAVEDSGADSSESEEPDTDASDIPEAEDDANADSSESEEPDTDASDIPEARDDADADSSADDPVEDDDSASSDEADVETEDEDEDEEL